jgi:hypothetical protein
VIWWLAACGGPDAEPEPAGPGVPSGGPTPEVARVVTPAPAVQGRTGVVVKPAERDPRWAEARCNDGTAFGYVVRPGPAPTWVINLSGGYFCDDERALCSERRRRLTTARPEADGATAPIRSVGVFSPDPVVNPTFARATHVDAHYCSSDLWLGDRPERRPTTGDPDRGWHFSGRMNVRALIEALAEVDGLDEADPETRILLLGTSAGAAGVVGNLAEIVRAWPNAARDGRLKVVLDGGWVAPFPPGVALPNGARWGPIEPGCAAERRSSGGDESTCIYGPEWWPHVAELGVPVLVQISGRDRTQTEVLGLTTPDALADWQARVRASLDVSSGWVYSVAEPYHVVAVDNRFGRGPEGARFRDVLDRFWRGDPPERVLLRY